jgi:putative methyltransferase
MLARASCVNVSPRNSDFLATDPTDTAFTRVTHILLDPSCSGSGIVNRLDYLLGAGTPTLDSACELDKLIEACRG